MLLLLLVKLPGHMHGQWLRHGRLPASNKPASCGRRSASASSRRLSAGKDPGGQVHASCVAFFCGACSQQDG